MKTVLSFIELLDIVCRCSVSDGHKNDFKLKIIDNMMIPESVNPLSELEEDTLKRVFSGSNSFSREYAKTIYGRRDGMRFSSFLRDLGEHVILNIETEIQDKEHDYEFDESCYKLAELMFSRLNIIAEKPRAKRTLKKDRTKVLRSDTSNLSVMEIALIAGKWNASNSKDILFFEKMSGRKFENIAKELINENNVTVKYPIWEVQSRSEYLDDLHKYITRDDIRVLFEIMAICMLGEDTCSLELMEGLAEFVAFTANNFDNVQYTKNDYNVAMNSFLRHMTESLDDNLSIPLLNVMPMLSEADMRYFLSVFSSHSISKQSENLGYREKYCIQEVLIKAGEYDRLFVDASKALFDYAQIDDFFYQGFLSLFTMWCSGTEAHIDKKCGVLKGLFMRNPIFVKNTIIDLLPGGKGPRVAVPIIHYSVSPKLLQINFEIYWEYETKLLDLLFENCELLIDDYLILSRRLPYLSEPLFDLLINRLSAFSNDAAPEERDAILEQLSSLLIQGKISDKVSKSIQNIIESHDYSFVSCLGKELFSYSSVLMVSSSTGVFKSIRELENARISKCRDIYKREGVNGILRFLSNVEDRYSYGVAVFHALKGVKIVNLVRISKDDLFNRGLVSQLNSKKVSTKRFSSFIEIAKYLIIDNNIIDKVTALPTEKQHDYWSVSEGVVSKDLSLENWGIYIENEMFVNQNDKVIISTFLHRDIIVDKFADKIYAALSCSAQDECISDFIYLSMVDALRSRSYDLDRMVELEFLALERYINNSEHLMISIHTKMSQDPEFFLNVVRKSYCFEHNYSYILHTWKVVPGFCNGCFGISDFNTWYNVVKEKSSDNILTSADHSLGKCLYGEYEKDWRAFLDGELALLLDNDNSNDIREGFILAPNYCIVVSFDNPEMPKYDEYMKQADVAISLGLINVGSALERIAEHFYYMYKEH